MYFAFRPGFSIYKKGEGPVFIVPHSGPALGGEGRDDGADRVASFCFEKMNGSLLISNMPRDPFYGIDLNRDIPPKAEALNMWKKIQMNPNAISKAYLSKYAWVAKNDADYNKKKKIYSNFWSSAKSSGNIFVIIHRKFALLKNYPSIMDFITFNGIGIDKKVLKKIIGIANKKYNPFFRKIAKNFQLEIINREQQILSSLELKQSSLADIKKKYSWILSKEVNIIKKNAEKKYFEEMRSNFTKNNFLRAVKNTMKNIGSPKITVERIFSGSISFAPRKFILKGNPIVLQIESDAFINEYYPKKGAEIILYILKTIDKYKKYKTAVMQKAVYDFLSS